jgi:hypothetical protein
MVHIMLLSRTRRTTPAFDAPGGFLFVNWEKPSGERKTL